MIFTIDRLWQDGAFSYSINPHHSNADINLSSEQFMPDHFSLQVQMDAPTADLQFAINNTDCRLSIICNPFQLKRESTDKNTSKCTTGYVLIGNNEHDVQYCQVKGKGFLGLGGHFYYELVIDENVYKIYDANQGSKGRNLCVYRNDLLVAVAQWTGLGSAGVVYTIYAENDIDQYALISLILYSDAVILRNDNDENALIVVMPKEIQNKYDPTFIERIAAQDNRG